MSKKMDPDIRGLCECVRGLNRTSERMREHTILYLWDRYVAHPKKPAVEHGAQQTNAADGPMAHA